MTCGALLARLPLSLVSFSRLCRVGGSLLVAEGGGDRPGGGTEPEYAFDPECVPPPPRRPIRWSARRLGVGQVGPHRCNDLLISNGGKKSNVFAKKKK
jgi:hypothetical protein